MSVDISKVNAYAVVGSAEEGVSVSKVSAYAAVGGVDHGVGVAKFNAYAIVEDLPEFYRRPMVTWWGIGEDDEAPGGGASFSGSGAPSPGLGINGDSYTRTDAPYADWVYRKSGGAWAVYTIPDRYFFTMGAEFTAARNVAVYSAASGEIPFVRWAPATLHYNNVSGNSVTAFGAAGVVRGDSSVVFGPVTDPSGNSQTGWIEIGCKSTDADDHGSNVKRSEEAYSETYDVGDEIWHAFALRDYTDSTGFWNFGRRSGSDYDGCDVQLMHDNDFPGGLPSFVALVYTVTNTGAPVRTWRMTHAVWNGSTYTMGAAQHLYSWAGGNTVTLANGRTAVVDPAWPGNAGQRWKFAVHVRLGMTGSYCKIWGAPFGSPLALLANNTTHAVGFDPTASGGSNTGAFYGKGRGMYQTSYPAGAWHFRTAKRRDVALRNKHQILLNAGHTEASIVAGFSAFLEA